MVLHPDVALCPQCGAPFELDEQGRCKWCRAIVRVQPDAGASPGGTSVEIAFFELCDSGISLPAPANTVLSGLRMLAIDPRVYQEFTNPAFLAEVRHLISVVQAAGERAADNGLRSWPNWLKDYTVEDMWCFQLGLDLMMWLATLDGVSNEYRRLTLENVENYDWDGDRHVRKALEKYGDGPAELQGLRARIPHTPSASKRRR